MIRSLAGRPMVAFGSAEEIEQMYEQREFGKAIREVMRIAERPNERFDKYRPWELAKDAALLQAVCSDVQIHSCIPDADNLSRARVACDCRAGSTRTVRDGSSIQMVRPCSRLTTSHRIST